MSDNELTDALDDAMENMTKKNYDSALIDAYLDALDCYVLFTVVTSRTMDTS